MFFLSRVVFALPLKLQKGSILEFVIFVNFSSYIVLTTTISKKFNGKLTIPIENNSSSLANTKPSSSSIMPF